jgi:cytochrome c oxidase subunit 2
VKHKGMLVLGIVLLGAGVVGLAVAYSFGSAGTSANGAGTSLGRYSSAGERIFQTGLNASGNPIPRTSLPISEGFLMMGGGGCASCHASDGHGGTVSMMMGYITTPDITYDALKSEDYDSDSSIARAIVDGLDEDGHPLERTMPRWKMTDAEVTDVISYLKELSNR